MASILIQSMTKQFGTQVVLDNLSLELRDHEIVGLIGVNGTGKTTLFRLIAGESQPDRGSIAGLRRNQIGYLPQEPVLSMDRSLHDEVGSAFDDLLKLERKMQSVSEEMAARHDHPDLANLMASYERLHAQFLVAGGHTFEVRLHEILSGLGFSQGDEDLAMGKLSGGQKGRAALAKLLLTDRPFLLLDEPTNHLDIDAVRWLERFLAGRRHGAVIISHDRYLLDRLCVRILEMERGRITSYPGNYSRYAQVKQTRLLTQQRQFKQDTAWIKKERTFIAKHLAGQRTREAQGRRKRLERRLDRGEFVTQNTRSLRSAKISFDRTDSKKGTIFRCDDLSMGFGEHQLFDHLTFQVYAGDRFAITGPNGTGKSTLVKIIVGELSARTGAVTITAGVRIGYYRQEAFDLDPSHTILEEVRAAKPEWDERQARSFLARFLFTGDDVFKKLAVLSGGEQSRVRLITLILSQPDVLILDEPTNHLDIPSREALEEALGEFPGTVVVVSHDRYFLDRTAERLLVMRPETQTVYAGNYSYYLQQLERERITPEKRKPGSDLPKAPSTARKKKKKGSPEQPRKEKSPTAAYDHLGVEKLEEMVVERETELALLQQRFGDPAVWKDPQALADLQEEIDALTAELAIVDAAWQDRVDTSS